MKHINYLSEKINELPINCLYNKGKVGCGGTTLAIEGNKPYIICVPFVSLIENKLAQYPNERRREPILAEYGERRTSKTFLENYVKNTRVPVIITTYDSLGVLTEKLGDLAKEFNLLVDEYHILFNHYSFRSEAAQSVLTNYKKYKSFTFMTATPLEEEFLLEELKGIPVVNEEWDDVVTVEVKAVKCKSVEASTAKLIETFLSGRVEGNAYLFVNSVKFIAKMVKKCGLTEENCRVIYSKNNTTKVGISNSSTITEPKKINFLTSTVFEGSDIYDENGRTFIISDANNTHTLLDISTSIMQIAGRIRNSKYIGKMMHLFTTTRYAEQSYDKFKENVTNELNRTESIIKDKFSSMSEEDARHFLNIDDTYVCIRDGKVTLDVNKVKVDLFNYKVVNGMYKTLVTVNNEYQKKGVVVSTYKDATKSVKLEGSKNFEQRCRELSRMELTLDELKKTEEFEELIAFYPFMKEAVNVLGWDRIKALNYRQRKIKDAVLLAKKGDNVDEVIKSKLESTIRLGWSYTNDEIKDKLQKAYDVAGLDKKAKGKDIEKWYSIKRIEHNTRIEIKNKKLIIFKND